jgi:hypothetical protein
MRAHCVGVKLLSSRLRYWYPKLATNKQTDSMVLVRYQIIPTERAPLVGEVSANFC